MSTFKFDHLLVESHTYCNRGCYFCPTPYIGANKIANKKVMDEKTLGNIVKQVNKHRHMFYDKLQISLFKLNEPLSDLDSLRFFSNYLKDNIEGAHIYVHTNGDYLTSKESFEETMEIVDELSINDYDNNDTEVYRKMKLFLGDNFILDNDLKIFKNELGNRKLKLKTKYKGKTVSFYVDSEADMKKFTRGSFINDYLDTSGDDWNHERNEERCWLLGTALDIEYDGSIMTCLQVSSRIEKHKDMIVGNINEDELPDVLPRYSKIDYSYEACKNCYIEEGRCQSNDG